MHGADLTACRRSRRRRPALQPRGRSSTPSPEEDRRGAAATTPGSGRSNELAWTDQRSSCAHDLISASQAPASALTRQNRLCAGRGGAVRRSSGRFAPVEVRRVLDFCSTTISQGIDSQALDRERGRVSAALTTGPASPPAVLCDGGTAQADVQPVGFAEGAAPLPWSRTSGDRIPARGQASDDLATDAAGGADPRSGHRVSSRPIRQRRCRRRG